MHEIRKSIFHLNLITRVGYSRGYAFVYVQNPSDVQKLIDYVDGRHIRSRQLRAKTSLGGEALKQAL